jgi:uncharacterized FAD-dependent dehydrogenase
VILACGHSAESLFKNLHAQGIFMEGKSFAMGLRVEHPQDYINKIQYRNHHENEALGAANYRLAHHDKKEDVGVYSFCMCPGGYVLSSATEEGRIVANGMSNYRRNSAFANAALVVSIDFEKSFGHNDLFAGMKLRQKVEEISYQMVQDVQGGHSLPAQGMLDFLSRKITQKELKSSSPSGVVATPLHEIFPENLNPHLIRGFEAFNRKMPGFIGPDAVLHAVESRTSCPLRITRDKDSLQSVSHSGLYPTGEGAGYAGGITSAACDGIRVAEAIFNIHSSSTPSTSEVTSSKS